MRGEISFYQFLFETFLEVALQHKDSLALFHFVWVSYFYYLIATLGFTTLKFKSPVTKKTTTLKYRNVLNPLAFALAA